MIQYNIRPVRFSLQDVIKSLEMKGLSSEEIKEEICHKKLKGQLPEEIYNRIREDK